MVTLKQLLQKTYQNSLVLKEREAKHSSNAPLELVNQISDHETAIELIKRALSTELTEAGLKTLKEELRPMLVASNVEQIDLDKVKLDLPRLLYEPETILIPAGPFLMGSDEGEAVSRSETPPHEVELPDYKIGIYPVTNEQYAEFIRQTRRLIAPESGWEGQIPSPDKLNHPVLGVTWYDALAFCDWLSEQSSRQYGLPSEAQWEKAARGTDGRIYPWGNEWETDRCNYNSSQTTAVDAYPPQSVYNCYDMLGNVREWTTTLWGEKRREPDPRFCYPWAADEREDLQARRHIYRVYRGGAAADKMTQLRCSARNGYLPDKPGPPHKRHGFRVVLSI